MAFGGADSKQRLECSHWNLTSVESEYELVEVDLQIFRVNPVVGSQEPGLEVREDSMNVRS